MIAEKEKWYRYWRFPLLPLLNYDRGDADNAPSFQLRWLILRIYSQIAPQFGLFVYVFSDCFGISLHLPYLTIALEIYYPQRVVDLIYRKLWRKGVSNVSSDLSYE